MSTAQSVHRLHTVLRAIGGYWTQMKKAEKPGGFYVAWTTICPGSELTLRAVSWEESAERWDAVSNKVRPLEGQPFHDDVHSHRGLATWETIRSTRRLQQKGPIAAGANLRAAPDC